MIKPFATCLAVVAVIMLILSIVLTIIGDGPFQYRIPISIKVGPAHELRVEADLERLVTERMIVERKLGTLRQIKGCKKFRKEFEFAAEKTGLPVELLTGLATIESGGCTQLENGKARGMMQIAFPGHRHLERAAKVMRVDVDQLDYHNNSRHNVVLGAVMLQDYTRRFGNVADGLEAYNQGPSKVEVGDHSDYPKYVIRVLAASQLAGL